MELKAAVCSREDGPMSEAPERLRFRRLRFGEAAEAGFTLIELLAPKIHPTSEADAERALGGSQMPSRAPGDVRA